LNTDLDRDAAKKAIVNRDKSDPELDDALRNASELKLGLAKENNRHTETMRGWFSRVFGHDDNVAAYIAAAAMFVGLAAFISCLFVAGHVDEKAAPFWSQQGERALAFSGSCLAFIFGKGIK
jgi:hypothetical protein